MECVKKGKKMKWLKSPSKYVNIWNIFSLPKFYIVHSSQGLLLLLWGRSLPCRWWADRQALVHWQWDSGNDDLTVTVLSLYCHCHHQVILSCAAGPAGPSIQVTVENCQTSGNQTGAPATTAAPAPSPSPAVNTNTAQAVENIEKQVEELVKKVFNMSENIEHKIDHVQTQVELIINIIHTLHKY